MVQNKLVGGYLKSRPFGLSGSQSFLDMPQSSKARSKNAPRLSREPHGTNFGGDAALNRGAWDSDMLASSRRYAINHWDDIDSYQWPTEVWQVEAYNNSDPYEGLHHEDTFNHSHCVDCRRYRIALLETREAMEDENDFLKSEVENLASQSSWMSRKITKSQRQYGYLRRQLASLSDEYLDAELEHQQKERYWEDQAYRDKQTIKRLQRDLQNTQQGRGGRFLERSNRQATFVSRPSGVRAREMNAVAKVQTVELEKSTQMQFLETLEVILSDPGKRKVLQELRDGEAQIMIDFLHFLLLHPIESSMTCLKKYLIKTLYRLCQKSTLYPQCFFLDRNLVTNQTLEDGGASCDIYKGICGDQTLCLKAVRIFKKGNVDAALKSYAKEAILWGQLQHPNIVPFLGIFHLDPSRPRICLVSPWMAYGNLTSYLKNNPALPRESFIHDVILGLEYLHSQHIIHGDLKGVNILVNGLGRGCLVDFGLASVHTNGTIEYTTASMQPGLTSRYSSPELLKGGNLPAHAGDIWAFGCTCYEIFTSQLPFHECRNEGQVILQIMKGEVPTRPQEAVANQINDYFWSLLLRCWKSKPEDRPSCQDILTYLKLEELTKSRRSEQQEHQIPENHILRNWTIQRSAENVQQPRVVEILQRASPSSESSTKHRRSTHVHRYLKILEILLNLMSKLSPTFEIIPVME